MRRAGGQAGADRPALETDVAVVGAGAAGLYTALCVARAGGRVVLISAAPLAQTASYWAQGGLAAALASDDSVELHLQDTERAGRGAVRRSAAEVLVREAPECVHELQSLGVSFDADRFGRLALGLEGGHSVRRVVHAGGSATGRRMLRQLSALVAQEPRIEVLENARARALWAEEANANTADVPARAGAGMSTGTDTSTSLPRAGAGTRGHARTGAHTRARTRGGVSAVDIDTSPPAHAHTPATRCRGLRCEDGRTIAARAVVLASGGAAALWSRTTNPPGSQGVGLLLAQALGARLADLELLQFHPTAVIGVGGREGFLVTEAIRGEGATLHDADGERFVDELAPRDEVSRAIQMRLDETGARSVGLDMRAIDPALFPNVVGALREAGLDPTRELVPVAPAAHYMMGGIVTDLQARTSVAGLYAVGESSCTGLHGANRLASNSLSECFVFARRTAVAALAEPRPRPAGPRELAALGALEGPPEATAQTREALWREAGIERSAEGLERLARDPHPLARLIARCALERKESRGVHRRADYRQTEAALEHRHVVIEPDGRLTWETWE